MCVLTELHVLNPLLQCHVLTMRIYVSICPVVSIQKRLKFRLMVHKLHHRMTTYINNNFVVNVKSSKKVQGIKLPIIL